MPARKKTSPPRSAERTSKPTAAPKTPRPTPKRTAADPTKSTTRAATAQKPAPVRATVAPKSRVFDGSKTIVDFLEKAGVDVIFGYPGGAVIPLYDALYDSSIKHVLTRHEQGAIHAADGYARASGRVGVVFATSGPGATNLVTGLATAHMDSVPILAVTGQVPTSSLGGDSFQEADIYGITIPITKYNYLVKDPQTLPDVLAEALHLAGSGRPGPVLVDVPKDVQTAVIERSEPKPVNVPGYLESPEPDPLQMDALFQALTISQRPVVYLGGGGAIAGVDREILALAERLDLAVVTTLQAKGTFPDDHPLSLGLPGMHGAKYANLAINESDLIVGLGVRFDDRVVGNVRRFAPLARIVHVDIDPAEIGKRLPVDVAVVGDLKQVLTTTLSRVKKTPRPEWRKRLAELRRLHPMTVPPSSGTIKPQAAIKALSDRCAGRAVVVTDVGQHQMWAAQRFMTNKPRRFLSSGGLGTMGFGLPAAIGAQFAKPDSQVVLVTGDGSFQMNIQELATVRQYDLPIKIMIINNGCLGMVRQWQQFFFQKRYSQTIFDYNPDFAALARVYGLEARRIDKPSEVLEACAALMDAPGPALLEVVVERDENVLPMIPAGMGQTDFFETTEETEDGN